MPLYRHTGFLVTERIDNAHPRHATFPLLQGDLLLRDEDGSYTKACPGIMVTGFRLTSQQEATLRHVEYSNSGLAYHVHGEP